MNLWIVISRESKARNRAGFKEKRLTTYLLSDPDCAHVLPGHHGQRVLTETAAAWNRSGFTATASDRNRARCDYLTEASRKNFTLSLSR